MPVVIRPKNLRQLSWNNFKKVRHPKSKGSDAQTAYKIAISKDRSGIIVTLKLDAADTWVRVGKASDELLKHEQGHWDIYLLLAEELDRTLQGEAAANLDSKTKEISEKYDAIDKQYDDETGHSQNKHKQEEWNCKLEAAKRNHNLDLGVTCEP